MNLTQTFKAITKEFPGQSNAGLRKELKRRAVAIAEARTTAGAEHDLMHVAKSVGLSALGQSSLSAVNNVFLAEISK